jgi:hypothetical protein
MPDSSEPGETGGKSATGETDDGSKSENFRNFVSCLYAHIVYLAHNSRESCSLRLPRALHDKPS